MLFSRVLKGATGRGAARAGGYVLLAVALLLAHPLYAVQYDARIANLILIYAIASLGVNVIVGYAGLVSIAHGSVMAVGAYCSALLMLKEQVPFLVAFIVASVVAAVLSGILGALGGRVRTNYFLLITLALSQAVTLVVVNYQSLTGGAQGLFGVPPAQVGGFVADTDAKFYVIGVVAFVVALYGAEALRKSRAGRAMVALRLNEHSAQMSGIDVGRYRIAAMCFGGFYLGAAGSLFAHLVQFLGPESFSISLALLLTLIVVVGGIGSNIGAVVSSIAVTVSSQTLESTGTTWLLYYGLLILVVLVVAPSGLAGVGRWAMDLIKRLVFRTQSPRKVDSVEVTPSAARP